MLCDEFILKSSVFDGKLKSWSDFSYLWEYMVKETMNVEKKQWVQGECVCLYKGCHNCVWSLLDIQTNWPLQTHLCIHERKKGREII